MNSIILRHEQAERTKERMEDSDSQEEVAGGLCEKCHKHTVINEFICLKTNTPLTAYCLRAGGPGCLYGRIGQCLGAKMIRICKRVKCKQIQEAK